MTGDVRTPAVVLSGYTTALAVVRSLGAAGVPVVVLHHDARHIAQTSQFVTLAVRVPDPMVDETGFIDAVMEQGRRFEGGVLIPTSDESVVAASRHKTRLQERYLVACPEWDITERFIDKTKTYELARANGIPAPRTVVPVGPEDLAACAAEVGVPALVKPAESHLFAARFKRKMFRVETLDELRRAYLLAREADLTVAVQELIPGPDSSVVNFNAYAWDGEARVEFTARQLRKAPPALGAPRVVISEHIPEVVEPGRKILAAMGFYGFACTEFKRDARDGTYKLLEVNGRHNLSGMLALRCGIDFPQIQYRHIAEGTAPTPAPFKSGVYWTDAFRDVGYSLAYLGREPFGAPEYLAPYARRHCDAIVDRRDMGPCWARLRYLAGNARLTARVALAG